MDIRLNTLTLENFKCHRSLSLDFGGENTTLRGGNAAGKTSVYDAFVWLLFGKDSSGSAAPDLKPLNADGNTADRDAVTAVEAVLLLDGTPLRLRRTLHEVWTTRRGTMEPSFEGNTSEFFIDGVPVRASAFKKRVESLADEDTFRLLTSTAYFAAVLPWQKRRELLFTCFGILTDREVMSTDSRFAPLLEALGTLTVEEFRARCQAEKKALTVTRNELPARISECEKTVSDLAALDFLRAESDAAYWNEESTRLQEELTRMEQPQQVQSLRMELREAELEAKTLEAENTAHRRAQGDAAAAARRRGELDGTISRLEARKKQLEAQLEAPRPREETPADVCPACGQPLTGAALAVRRTRERRHREEEEGRRRALQQEQVDIIEELLHAREERHTLEAAQVQDLPGYTLKSAELRTRIQQLRDALLHTESDARHAAARKREALTEARTQLRRAQETTAKRAALDYARARIQQLRADADAAAEQLRRVEEQLTWLDAFTRYKASFVEEDINSRFRLAAFRLFRAQTNGGVEERCDVTHNGIPYSSLNSGMRTNVGIDILNTLTQTLGITAPLFLDNAESVPHPEPYTGQLIRLTVDESCPTLEIQN